MVLLALRGELPGIDVDSLTLAAESGPIESPISWLRFGPERGLLLVARPQPGLRPGKRLLASDDAGGVLPLVPEAAPDLAALVGVRDPATLHRVLGFIASRAAGMLRRADDGAVAAACHDFAAPVAGPTATAVALCGTDSVYWALPAGVTAGSSFVIGRHRLRLVRHGDSGMVLADRRFEGGLLLPAGAAGPILLAPPAGALPTLAELGQRKDSHGRQAYRAAIAELGRCATEDEEARRLLRDHQLLAPIQQIRQVTEPDLPYGGALEMALDDHGGGLFLRGWLRDPLGLITGLSLRSGFGDIPLPGSALIRFARPDLVKKFAEAPHGSPGLRAGFVVHLPDAAARPAAQWALRARLSTGDLMTLVAPPAVTSALLARDRILGAIAPAHVTDDILTRCIAPPVERLHKKVMSARVAAEVIRIGTPVAKPVISLIVPIYRNVHYLRHQLLAIARDPSLAEAELIYVLDSPEQREDLEHMLRGYHGILRMPLTLVVQPANYGYGSACNVGAAEARAPVLLLLNSDVVPAARGWLRPMLAALAAAPRMAAVGPKLLFANGSLQHAGLYFERGDTGDWYNAHYFKGYPRGFAAAQIPREVPGVTGAAFCVRQEAFRAVGGINTDYVVGDFEDSDLCLRLRADGGTIGYVPGSELFHFERQSISLHAGYTRTLASAYNRGLHHRRWSADIAALMARDWQNPGVAVAG